jgi:Tol biopolymer transport system component
MRTRSRVLASTLSASGLLVAAIGSPTAPVTAADASAAPPTPVCRDRDAPSWVTNATHPGDGAPDPAGRIVFGQIAYNDEIVGQVIAPVFAVDPDGSDLQQILDCELVWPRVSPDGSRLVFSIMMSDGSKQIATSATDGTDLRILTSTTGYADGPDWSPDGTWIAYSLGGYCASMPECVDDGSFRPRLWRIDADGSDARLLGQPDTIDVEPHVSPDGTEVVFDRADPADDFRFAFMIRDLATGAERRVFAGDRDLEHPAWSPDGRSIIYNTLAAPDGSFLERIELAPADDPTATPKVLYGDADHPAYKPTYSPDGSSIVFGCDGQICRMDADGSNVVQILEVPGAEANHMSWGVVKAAAP